MLLLPLFLLLLALPAAAQSADSAAAPDRWKVAVDLAFSGSSGNSEVALLTSGVNVTHLQTERYELEASAATRLGRSEGEEVERSAQAGLKFDLHPAARWSPFVFLNVEHEPFRRLELRTDGGSGVKRVLWEREGVGEAAVSAAALLSGERLAPAADGVGVPYQRDVRTSWRFRGWRSLGGAARLENTAFIQPAVDEVGDYLVDVRTALTVRVSRLLAVRILHAWERDSRPPSGIQPDDQVVTVGFSLEL